MIKVQIRCSGHGLFEGIDDGDVVEMEEGTTVAGLFKRLGIEERFQEYIVPYVNDDPKDLAYIFQDGDELRPFVPVSGG
jgi:sulfur carrier protein ThiS